jgi:ADP-L-glycero-D-manno-heptose 6-epimerase
MILVTGANGFIGSMLLREINLIGSDPLIAVDSVGLVERPDLLKNRTFSRFFLKDDIWSFLGQPEAKKIKWILHMGACSSTTEKNWDFLLENNVEYSQKIFQWCAVQGVGLVYASSAATYGDGCRGFDDETDPKSFKPLNLYGQSKNDFDIWALEQKNTPPHWYGLKFFNVFGPHEYHKGAMSSVAYKAFQQVTSTGRLGLFKSYHPNYADGQQKRDFIYVKDVTRWILELMQKHPQSGIYNMGTGSARTWLDLAHAVFLAMNKKVQIDWLEMPSDLKAQYQYFTEARMDKWTSQKMSSPRWSLEAAIDDYVKNYLLKDDPYA